MILLFVLKDLFRPVDDLDFNIIALPIPEVIPPYIHAKNLSVVKGFAFSNIFKNIDSITVPISALAKKFFPFFISDNIKSGIFKINIVVPSGTLNK